MIATAGTLLASLLLEPVRAFLGSVWRVASAAPGTVWDVLTASVPVWVLLLTAVVVALIAKRARARAPAIPSDEGRVMTQGGQDAGALSVAEPRPWRYPKFMKVPPLPPERERVYVRAGSPDELLASLAAIPPLQRRKVAHDLYAGRWIRFPAVVETLQADDHDGLYTVFVAHGKRMMITVTFPADRLAHVEPLRPGDRVTVDGQIREFDDFDPGSFEVVHATITRREEDGSGLSRTRDRAPKASR
jgi:hypothetical protein